MAPKRPSPEPVYIVRSRWNNQTYTPVPACHIEGRPGADAITSNPARRYKGPAPALYHWCCHPAEESERPQRYIPDFKGRRQPIMKTTAAWHPTSMREEIEEGQVLATADLILPWSGEKGLPGPWWSRRFEFGEWEDDMTENEWYEEEERSPVVVEGEAQGAGFDLSCLPRSEETYTIRTKERKPKKAPDWDRWDVVSVASACSFVKL